MSYLVTRCSSCGRVRLVAAPLAQTGKPACSQCGHAASVVPSCVYTDTDTSLFEELSETVAEGGITSLEAGRLLHELERALATMSYDRFFELLSSRMPGLTPIQVIFGGKPSAQLRALRMLATIFEAIAMAGRSGIIPAVAASPRSMAK
jgi:hypothetical protein